MKAGDIGGGLSQGEGAERRAQIRIGALSAILGGLIALVTNLLHPDLPDDPEAILTLVAANTNWGLLHFGIMASIVCILGGLHSLSRVAQGSLARGLGHLGVVIATPGAAIMLTGLAIDGFATKGLADVWAGAAGAEKADAFRVALAVEQVQTALFHTWSALFVGAPFLLLGLAGLVAEGGFPRWLGAIGAVGGTGALVMGVSGFLGVELPGLLFTLSAALVTLWVLIAGGIALRGTGRLGVAVSGLGATVVTAPGRQGKAM